MLCRRAVLSCAVDNAWQPVARPGGVNDLHSNLHRNAPLRFPAGEQSNTQERGGQAHFCANQSPSVGALLPKVVEPGPGVSATLTERFPARHGHAPAPLLI